MTQHLQLLIAVLASACLLDCVRAEPSGTLFEHPEAKLSQEVVVRGYLIYDVENRNIFPTRDWNENWHEKKCIPIGIPSENDALDEKAAKLTGRYVIVRGRMLQLVEDEQLNLSFCRRLGIRVDEIEPARLERSGLGK